MRGEGSAASLLSLPQFALWKEPPQMQIPPGQSSEHGPDEQKGTKPMYIGQAINKVCEDSLFQSDLLKVGVLSVEVRHWPLKKSLTFRMLVLRAWPSDYDGGCRLPI